MVSLVRPFRQAVSRCARPIISRAAARYIAGPELLDALAVVDRLTAAGYGTTLGFWDGEGDTPIGVQCRYLADFAAIVECRFDGYVSIKLPALRDQPELLDPVVEAAIASGVKLHFDSHGTEVADAMWQTALAARARGAKIGCSVPSRWRRSAADAESAIAAGIDVRLVKGQWEDPAEPTRNARDGFVALADQLAGRASFVAVATHDAPSGSEAAGRLQAAGTGCQWELLHGLPTRRALAAARELGISVRFYVPYGQAYLPYALAQAKRNPRLLGQLMLDACRGWFER